MLLRAVMSRKKLRQRAATDKNTIEHRHRIHLQLLVADEILYTVLRIEELIRGCLEHGLATCGLSSFIRIGELKVTTTESVTDEEDNNR